MRKSTRLAGLVLGTAVGSCCVQRDALAALAVPGYSSLPAAQAKLYLDFDGDYTASWGGYAPGTTPAYSIDGDASSFSSQELSNIHEIWSRVAEMYSPFNIDVTTIDPGNLYNRQTLKVVIGGDGKNGATEYWSGSKSGGVSLMGSFYNVLLPNVAFVFSDNLGLGFPKYVADAAAHEAGHAFGLAHQSTYAPNGDKLEEYNPGTVARAPIMGLSYHSTRALWWYGTTASPTTYQNDVDVLSNALNGFGYRADDYGDGLNAATALDILDGAFQAQGVIHTIADVDFFSLILAQDSELAITVSGAPFGQMLDASVALYDSEGQLLQLAQTASLNESLSASLLAGTYGLAVFSAAQIGDIGQYFLSGTVTVIPEPAFATAVVGLLGVMLRLGRATRPK
ncbi:hypothetical protein [Fontivita pretiosa]|uniref:hypothetical protein n=1 Tax=Fontivita pretiosa TaxID=2989684 RepID=UPI003D1871FC